MANENHALPQDTKLQGGKFVVKKVLGQGGFGITYLCEHLLMGQVVVKELFLYQACMRDSAQLGVKPLIAAEEFLLYKDRFLDEARTLVKLKNIDGIVHVFDFFEENNTVYFAMEYIAAEPLLDLIYEYRRLNDKIPEYLAVELLQKVSVSLKKVHDLGILHRDIKPHNILVGDKWKPYLIDFGIARSFQEGKTTYHTTMATPGYSAPEQMTEAGKKTASMDIYALGATLYFCLTQKHPQTLAEIAINGYLPAKQLNPAISDRVNEAITKAMSLKSENRFQTIAEWLDALGVGERQQDRASDQPNAMYDAPIIPDKTEFFPKKEKETELIATKSQKQRPSPKVEEANSFWRKIVIVIVMLGAIWGSYQAFFAKKLKDKEPSYNKISARNEPKLQNKQLEIEWLEDENSKGLIPEWQELMFKPYDNSFSCTVNGYLKLDKIEVSKLALQMAFFDENEQLVHTENYEPMSQSDDIIYRSGDLIPIHNLIYEEKKATRAWKKVKIKVEFIQKTAVSGKNIKSKPLPLKWINEPSENYKLAVRSRFDNLSIGISKNKSFHKLEYEVENIGNYSLKSLELAIYYYDKKGSLMDKCERYVFSEGDAELKAGQTRIFYSTCGFDADISNLGRFEVVVVAYK